MNHSKYNPKLDPKNTSDQPKIDAKVGQATVNVLKTADMTAVTAINLASKPADVEVNDKASTAPMQVVSTPAEKAGEAMISEGGNSAVEPPPYAVREPSALTGNLQELPAAPTDGLMGDKAPAQQAKLSVRGEAS